MTAAPGPRHVPDGALPASAIVAAALFLGIALDPSTRIGLVGSIGRPLRPTIAVGIIMFGLWIVVRALRAARNTHFGLLPPLAPIAPPPDLSSDNVYAQSRNPLYLGLGVLGFGIAVFLGSDCATLLLIPAALVIHFGLVRREERQFEQAFGDDYRRYEARVPRYGLPLPRRSPDCARVIAPAPVIAFATMLAGLALDELARPSNGIDSLPGAITIPIAIGVFVTGASILARAIGAFQRVGTHVFPHLPSRALALDGIYCQTRNPMYQAMGVFVLGFALVLRSDWTLLLLIPAALFVHYGIVIREERYLEQKFGDAYRRYRNDVPRYGLPLPVSRHAPGGSSEDGD